MTQNEEEELYVYFYEMDTAELLRTASMAHSLPEMEITIIHEVCMDRRDEINSMIELLKDELKSKKTKTIILPVKIISQVIAWENLTDTKSMIL